MTLFRSAFSYLPSKILPILGVKLIVPSDSRNSSTYALIKGYSGLTLFSIKGLKLCVLKYTIGAEHPLNVPLPPNMMFSDNFISNPKVVSKYLPRIISYILFLDLAI